MHKLYFETNSVQHKDGRINGGFHENGNYEDYCFAELIIGDELPWGDKYRAALFRPFTAGPLIFRKLFGWDNMTERLAAETRSDRMPKYRF